MCVYVCKKERVCVCVLCARASACVHGIEHAFDREGDIHQVQNSGVKNLAQDKPEVRRRLRICLIPLANDTVG